MLVNKVRIKGIAQPELHDGAQSLVLQKPNKRLFGFWRFYLRAYNFGMRGDTSRWIRRSVRKNIGEPPVILDSSQLNVSARQIKAYMFNHGYFNSDVKYEVKTTGRKKQKAEITFNVVPAEPYRIKSLQYGIDDRKLYYLVLEDTAKSLIKAGDIFNSDKMAEERERITARLRNEGYYFFNKEYISFSIDSNMQGNFVTVDLQIRNPDLFRTHKQYHISAVYLNVVPPVYSDTIAGNEKWYMQDSVWVNLNGYRVNEDILLHNIIPRPGRMFKQIEVDYTYSRLNNIQIFRQSSISFETDTIENTLICYINLYPDKRQEIVLEPQIISSEQNNSIEQNNLRNLGVANVIQYRNKNIFKNAELFELRYRIALEGQVKKSDTIPFFSNLEHTVTASINLPRIFVLDGLQRIFFSNALRRSTRVRNMRSAIISSYTYESNVDFNRNVLSLAYTESFDIRRLHTFNVSWMEVSYNRTNPKRNFLSLVSPADSIFVANLFITNIITNSRYSWVYTDRPITKTGSVFSSRLMIEPAGNSLYALMKLTKQPLPSDGIYKIDNVNFEQFVKIDGDIRYTHVLNELYSLASRLHVGVGLPYGNSKVMPFVRRYFIGGANSLRGWRPRTLGPGDFYSTQPGVRVDRSGEMIIEAQTEYRFLLIRNLLEGAMFIDAGNIWYTKPLPGQSQVNFRFSNFMDQMALNTGLGIRFDFSFLIVRLDFGIPLRNPELPSKTRWLFDDYANGDRKFFRSIILNLGLGYPF